MSVSVTPGHEFVDTRDLVVGNAVAGAVLDQEELEPADVVGRRGVGRALEICREPLAAAEMASPTRPRVRTSGTKREFSPRLL